MNRARGALPVALLALLLGATGSAREARAEDEAEGRVHFARGQELFKAKRFLEAAHEFEVGFEAAPRPLFLLNIGHSYRRAEQFRKAKSVYELLLRVEPNTPYRKEVEGLIKTIDDALESAEPLPPPPRAAPGTRAPPATAPPAPPPVRPSAPAPRTPAAPPATSPSSAPAAPGSAAPAGPVPVRVPRPLPALRPTPPPASRPAPPTVYVLPPAPPPEPEEPRSMWRSPWLWGAIGSAVVAGAVVAVMISGGAQACSATGGCFSEPRK